MKKIIVLLFLTLISCGSDQHVSYSGPCPLTHGYYKADGSVITDCSNLNFCANPANVYDENGDPFPCDKD